MPIPLSLTMVAAGLLGARASQEPTAAPPAPPQEASEPEGDEDGPASGAP